MAAGADEDPSGAEIVERALAALGGRETWAQMETTYTRGSLEFAQGTGSYDEWRRRPDRLKLLVDLGIFQVERAFDGEEAWEKRGPTRNRLTGPDRERLHRRALFQPLEAFREMKAPMELVGREQVEGQDAWAIEIRPPAGAPERWFIDAESFLPLREVRDEPTSEGDVTRITTYGDYREVGGILLPFKVTVETAGALQVIGPLKVVLYASSSAKDTDFTAKLLDVHPEGPAYNLQEGILRARYREGYEKNLRMKAGEVVRLEIDLHATAHTFAPGHRILARMVGHGGPAPILAMG